MYKTLFSLMAILSLSSTHLYAVEFGVGMNLSGSGNTIYLPVNISENIRLEPYLSAFKSTSKGGPLPTAYSNTFEVNFFGLGIFNIKHISGNKNVIIGMRAAYLRGKRNFISGGVSTSDYVVRGYSIGPVLGVEYFPISGLSIGGDVTWVFSKRFEHSQDSVNSDVYNSTSNTTTSATIKYYFE